MKQIRTGNYDGLEWMQNKTVILLGDSIERDHVSLFCSLMGREAETIKGKHPLAVSADSLGSKERRKKDRASRIAFRGMQESTLPRVCFIEEINFMVCRVRCLATIDAGVNKHTFIQVANLYHFGLDEQEYWANLDQFHSPGSIEERFHKQFAPFMSKLRADQRPTAPDLVEISSGMYDLARWAKQDISGHKNTEEVLSDDRLAWYESRINRFMDLTATAFPNAIKVWRAVTIPEDQAAELDYFNVGITHYFFIGKTPAYKACYTGSFRSLSSFRHSLLPAK